MTAFDPADPKYQICSEFEPDKEGSWSFPAEKDVWVHGHNALRGEMRYLREALEAIKSRGEPLKEWEVNAVKTAMSTHSDNIHGHHSNEDEVMAPEFRKRFKYPDKLETDHEGLVAKLEKVEMKVKEIKLGDTIDDLLIEFTEYENIVLPHLAEEEEIGLPLMRAYFKPEEMDPIIQKLISRSPPTEIGSFVYFIGVDTLRTEFMPQNRIPGFLWWLVFKSKYHLFLKMFVIPVEALKAGTELSVDTSTWCTIV